MAASTTEAEYIAMAAAVREALLLRQLLKDLAMVVGHRGHLRGQPGRHQAGEEPGGVQPVEAHRRVVPLLRRERVARKDVKIAYVKTDDMLADMLTKPVEKAKLDLCNRGIGMGVEATHASIDRPSGSVVIHD